MPATEKLTVAAIESELAELNRGAEEDWQLIEGKLNKQFIFINFIAAMKFMQTAAEKAEAMNHHPEWCNVYNRVTVNLVTHSVNGLSTLDFKLANQLEKLFTKLVSD